MKLAVGVVAAALAALAAQYFMLIRPWYGMWGATSEEADAALPGDALLADATVVETRAITVAAPPRDVWPALERLATRAGPAQRVAEARPERALVLAGDAGAPGLARALPLAGTRAYVLVPEGGGTRVLVRSRAAPRSSHPGLAGWAYRALVHDPVSFAADRDLLLALQAQAEGRAVAAAWRSALDAALWLATLALAVATLVALAFRRRTAWRPLLSATVAAFVMTALFFAHPPVWASVLLVAGLAWLAGWSWRRAPAPVPPAAAAV